MYLVDTNIFLHILLKKDKHLPAISFLKSDYELFITEFSIYSICILLSKLKKYDLMNTFVEDILSSENISIISNEPEDIEHIVNIEKQFDLDFDDAYQYYTATRDELIIVSYDTDFERTTNGFKKPEDVIS
ncbi:MAG: type II toxin-antitoxin system VapC family toxin [Candidatus Cloacimonetes bacterium]|nr:type II toxin-antitoxin system VapC family toxin [Candidatus Cloacimonadota bacterium]